MSGRCSVSTVAAWFVLASFVSPAVALDMAALRQLAHEADMVVVATCTATHAGWDDSRQLIVTRATLEVERYLKGAGRRTLTVHTLGGRVGTAGMSASHTASFAARERSVLFLRYSAYGPYAVVHRGAGGKLTLPSQTDGAAHAGESTQATIEHVIAAIAALP